MSTTRTTQPERKRISTLERMRLSTNGNPRFRVTFTDGTVATTQVDSGLAYGLENRENRENDVWVTFTLGTPSRAPQIVTLVPADGRCTTCLRTSHRSGPGPNGHPFT